MLLVSHSIGNYFQCEDISGQIRKNVRNKVFTKRTTNIKTLKFCHLVQDPLCFNTWYKLTILTLACTSAGQGCSLKEILQRTCVFRIVRFTLLHIFHWRICTSTPCDEQTTGENMRAFFSLRQLQCNSAKKKICSYILFWYYILFSHNCIL